MKACLLHRFLSVKSAGAKGDGTTDDTAAIQAVFDKATVSQVVYFDHGAYIITKTVKVPSNIKITGEIWPLIMASGTAFSSQTSPAPVFQVGQPGSTGAVEMSDLMFETKGAAPGRRDDRMESWRLVPGLVRNVGRPRPYRRHRWH